jgi:HTH-type transcriptional regulator/antitoxin HigA
VTDVPTGPTYDLEGYTDLLGEYMPHPIHSEADLETAEQAITALLSKPDRSSAEDEILELVSDLVSKWEDDHDVIPDVHGVELVKLLLAEREQPQRVLTPVFGTESAMSEVLSGSRPLQTDHILALGRFFGTSPGAFLPS